MPADDGENVMNNNQSKGISGSEALEYLKLNVISHLTEGILVTDATGTILYANHSSYDILNLPPDNTVGQKLASVFFDSPENDAFFQTVLDALYSKDGLSESLVPFYTEGKKKLIRMYVTYYPRTERFKEGLILVFTDLSELMELRDAAQDMAKISRLNRQLTMRNELLQKTFGMFLSDEIVRDMLDKQGGPVLGGIKKNITIMMSDLRGFTALSEQMEAEDLISMLNHYLGVMTEIIQKRGGIIIEFIGDGIMAIFGASGSSDSHAADGVCAAIEMQAAMSRVNQWNARRDYPRLEMGIGVNTGDVIVGNVGSKKRMKYGVVGSHVNKCGRIESYTIGGQILISPDTRDAVSSPLKIERELIVSPKGVGQDVTLSHVTGIGEPYNVSIKTRNDTPKRLSGPIPVCFHIINGKHTEDEIHFGGLTAIGRGTALLRSELPLNDYDNLRIEAGGHLLCKVINNADGEYLLQFTSIPSAYNEWVRSHTKKT